MHDVQETQKPVSKQTGDWEFATYFFCPFDRICIQSVVQAIDTS